MENPDTIKDTCMHPSSLRVNAWVVTFEGIHTLKFQYSTLGIVDYVVTTRQPQARRHKTRV